MRSLQPATRFLPLLLLLACAPGTGSSDWIELRPTPSGGAPLLHVVGRVQHNDLEGGFYLLRDDQGNRYNPLNLPDRFRLDGMPIEAEARPRNDVSSIGMVGQVVELVRIRRRDPDELAATNLAGTRWRLDELGGVPAIREPTATLEFGSEGAVSGRGTCNRFTGQMTIEGMTIVMGPIATTRMACAPALMNQEDRYLATLGAATRLVLRPGHLELLAPSGAKSLRFVPDTP